MLQLSTELKAVAIATIKFLLIVFMKILGSDAEHYQYHYYCKWKILDHLRDLKTISRHMHNDKNSHGAST